MASSTPPNLAAPLTVAEAIATQNGTSQNVRGYVVGQPTATKTVVISPYPNDYALAFRSHRHHRVRPRRWRYAASAGRLVAVRPDVLRPGKRQDRHRAAHRAARDHQGARQADLRPDLERVDGHRPGPEQHGQCDRALLWPADLEDAERRRPRRLEPRTCLGAEPRRVRRCHRRRPDLHHLRPEDVTVNSTRGNKDFDLGGTAVSQCGDCRTDSDSFEPCDSVKGDVIWNTYQHSRNPFIDHPEWAQALFG